MECDSGFTLHRTLGARKARLDAQSETSYLCASPMDLRPGLRVERIVSRGHVTAADSWYDQDEHEWVCVVSGSAKLEVKIEARVEVVELDEGDWLELPAHTRHRVVWTRPDVDTIWLAVFSRADGPA